MEETRRKFDADFREGAVRLVRETGKCAELELRCDVLKRSAAGPLTDASFRETPGLTTICRHRMLQG